MVLFADQRFDRDRNGDGAIFCFLKKWSLLELSYRQNTMNGFFVRLEKQTFDSKLHLMLFGALRLIATPHFSLSDEYKELCCWKLTKNQYLQNLSTIRW